MTPLQRSNLFIARIPTILIGGSVALFAAYFLFLRDRVSEPADAGAQAEEQAALEAAAPAMATVPARATPSASPIVVPPVAPRVEVAPPPMVVVAPDPGIDQLIAADKHHEARAEIATLFAGDLHDSTRTELAAKAIMINKRLLVTHPDPRDVEFAEMMQGESLSSFARRFKPLHGEYGVVQLVNNIRNVTTIRAGARLRVPKGVWSIVVDKSLFTLYLCYQGAPYKTYRVCIGADDKTPAVKWTVGLKNPKPSWSAPTDWLEKEKLKNPIDYGHPKNPLGEYWISLESDSYSGFGIHGTNQPETMGTRASMGCVRMVNEEVVEIARCVWKGMAVTTME